MTAPVAARAGPPPARRWARSATALLALGAVALVAGSAAERGDAALVALEAGWLFLASLAAGAVALAASVHLARGRWADPVRHLAETGAAFFRPALALLVPLLAGEAALTPGRAPAGSLAVRAALLALSGLLVTWAGGRFVAGSRAAARAGSPPGPVDGAATAYLVAYAASLSAWAWVLAPDLTGQPSFTVVPPYFFMGAFLSGVAGVALMAAIQGRAGSDVRHDLGKLLFGLSLLVGYLLWSLVLPTWYGNVPAEAEVLLDRWSGAARPLAWAVLAAVLVLPFVLLLPERWKRGRATLAAAAASILCGLWAERFLLVRPPQVVPDLLDLLVGAGVTAGLAGLFLRSVGGGLAEGPRTLEPPSRPLS